ncbi:hypothetical protein FN846DRAFT_935748 [Sphaerosporella brunnea]|uniref:Transmembrane protein n=1 Tax=Sphaerosporella brunnea TaxID=1250544 RepID=A0A5J5F5G1_9PEZI|nr:hypothetical protein FN846DRAFT_935748 [Sphaerosporella brunnea]
MCHTRQKQSSTPALGLHHHHAHRSLKPSNLVLRSIFVLTRIACGVSSLSCFASFLLSFLSCIEHFALTRTPVQQLHIITTSLPRNRKTELCPAIRFASCGEGGLSDKTVRERSLQKKKQKKKQGEPLVLFSPPRSREKKSSACFFLESHRFLPTLAPKNALLDPVVWCPQYPTRVVQHATPNAAKHTLLFHHADKSSQPNPP